MKSMKLIYTPCLFYVVLLSNFIIFGGGFENFCRSLHKTEAMTEIFNCGMKKWNNAKISIICMLTQFDINIQFSFISSHFYSKQACSVENKA